MSRIIDYRGGVCVVGDIVQSIASKYIEQVPIAAREQQIVRDGRQSYHITALSAGELRDSSFNIKEFSEEMIIIDFGIAVVSARDTNCWYVVIYSPTIQLLRQKLGLPEKDLHITLGFSCNDVYGATAGGLVRSMVNWCETSQLLLRIDEITETYLGPKFALLHFQLEQLLNYLAFVIIPSVSQLKSLGKLALALRMKDICDSLGWAMLNKGILFGLKLLLFSAYLRKQPLELERWESHFPLELSHVGPDVESQIHKFNQSILAMTLQWQWSTKRKLLIWDSSERTVKICTLPRNFSWVALGSELNSKRFCLAGSAIPTSADNICALATANIRLILTVHEQPLEPKLYGVAEKKQVTIQHLQVVDRTPPTVEQMVEAVKSIHSCISNGHGVLVHCQGGVGRTNTILIAYLMCVRYPLFSAAAATQEVTEQRKIILAVSQKEFLRKWYFLIGRDSSLQFGDQFSDDVVEMQQVQTTLTSLVAFPPLLLMCGVACSGKSTFSQALVSASPERFIRINRDEMRGKGQIDELLRQSLKDGLTTVILDGCHLTKEKRQEWLHAAHNVPSWCISFERPMYECQDRIQVRENHPIIPPGTAGLRILESMARQWEPPLSAASEGVSQLFRIGSDEDMAAVLCEWGIPFTAPAVPEMSSILDRPIKFPRTAHVMNLGAATRDDKVLGASDAENWIARKTKLIVEEKVDGANLGIWIRSVGGNQKIVVQNRSHFVTSSYHPQFGPLDKWIAQHSSDLWSLLEPNETILYGEWLHATHSVAYVRLPSYFIAYDLYRISTQSFLPRHQLSELLEQTSIPQVPLLFEGCPRSVDEIKAMTYGPSMFGDQPREGIVIRVCSDEKLELRAKLVRPDFIAGNERWNRSATLKTNSLSAKSYL